MTGEKFQCYQAFPRDFRDIWMLSERLANVEVFMALLFVEIQSDWSLLHRWPGEPLYALS